VIDMKLNMKIFDGFKNLICLGGALVIAISCDPGGNKGTGDGGDDGYYEFPLNWQEDGYEAGDNGVSVSISEVEEKNVVFTLVPGSVVKSYKVLVYPKAMIYNLLLNEGCVGADKDKCEDVIIDLVSASEHVFNASSSDDYAAKEFDWHNTVYADVSLVSDCDYFILVLGCYDDAAENPASLSISHFKTREREVVGDPSIGIETEVGYRAFIVRYHPNEDCKYFYHWIWSTDQMSEYIDLFGEKMMRDFCRTSAYEPFDSSVEANLSVKRTFDVADEVYPHNTVVAVALDANGTPSKDIFRYDFSLLSIPEGDFSPKASIRAGDRVGATIAYFDVSMERNCMSCFYRLYTKAEADALKSLSDSEKELVAISIAAEGWGVANTRFSFNTDIGALTGDAFSKSDEFQAELKPDTEYVIVYVAKNYFAELSGLCFSDPFRTRKLVRDNPAASLADVELTLSDVSRWGFKYNFTYTYSKTACYRFQIVWPYMEEAEIKPPHYVNDADDREKWMTFFYDTYQESPAAGLIPIANMWDAEPAGSDGYSMYGYEAGVKYVVAYCGEDINGVVGPVKFVEVTTTAPNPGPNPTIRLEDLRYDDEDGAIKGRFVTNEDSKKIFYFSIDSSDTEIYENCEIYYLLNTDDGNYGYYSSLWKEALISYGLSTSAESASVAFNAAKSSSKPVMVAAIAVGENETGDDVYSPVVAKIYVNGEFKDLSDFRTPVSE